MREAQRRIAACAAKELAAADATPERDATIGYFLACLTTAWRAGEVRPTHRRKPTVPHDWRTRPDPIGHTWPKIQQWLETEPVVTAKLQN